jgi:hypothetical protein
MTARKLPTWFERDGVLVMRCPYCKRVKMPVQHVVQCCAVCNVQPRSDETKNERKQQ